MDALPPDPPAVVTSEHQAALATIARLLASRDWLSEQSSALLAALTPPADDTVTQRRQVDAFWSAAVPGTRAGPPLPRRAVLADRFRAFARDEASLRFADGTLDTVSHAVVMKATAAAGPPPGVVVHEMLLGDAVYPGAMAVEDAAFPDVVLLFTTTAGWQAYPSWPVLHEAFRDLALAGQDIHALAAAIGGVAADSVGNDTLVNTRALTDAPWSRVAAAMESAIAARIAEAIAWPDDDSPGQDERLRDRLAAAVDPTPWIDPLASMASREARLVDATIERRLARSVKPLRAPWRAAAHAYAAALRDAEPPAELLSLHAFTRDRLTAALRAMGIADDADTLLLRRRRVGGNKDHVVRWNEDVPLVDAALRSIGWLNVAPVEIVGARDKRIRMSQGATVDLLRRLDIHATYPAYLSDRLRDSAAGKRRRDQAMAVVSARMRFDLEDARVSMYIPGEPGDLLADHAERGYDFVRAVLDAPVEQDRRRVDGHVIEVRQLELEGARLAGVLEIGAQDVRAVPRVILYTPDAPDGRAFREFADRGEAMRRFFAEPRFAAYLAQRLPASWAGASRDGTTQRFCFACPTGVVRGVTWASPGNRFVSVRVSRDFRAADDDTTIARLGLEASRFTRPTAEADYDDAAVLGQVALDVGLGALPLRVGIAISIGRSLHAAWQGAEHAARGEQAEAAQSYIAALSMGADLVTARITAQAAFRSVFVRTNGLAGSLQRVRLPSASRVPPFDRRYLANDIDTRQWRPVGDGVLTDGRRHVIEQDGYRFSVVRDTSNATWRLAVPDGPGTAYRPPVHRRAGRWEHRREVGLVGGMDARPELADETPASVLERYYRDSPDTIDLTPAQRRALTNVLGAGSAMTDAAKKKAIYDGIHRRATRAVRDRWDAALREARRTPAALSPAVTAVPAMPGHRLEKLERSAWPDKVYHYTKRTTYDEYFRDVRGDLYLHQSTPLEHRPAGLYVTTVDPRQPTERIAAVMRGKPWVKRFRHNTPMMNNLAGGWVEIDLRKLGDRQRPDGSYEFNVYTVTHRSAQEFVIRPTLIGSPTASPPPSPSQSRDLMSVRLQPGEYSKGTRP
jgi:hypothetical protein